MKVAFLEAIYNNDLGKVREILLSESPDAPLTTFLQRPLHFAVRNRNREMVRVLVEEFGAEVDCTDVNGWTPLGHIAVLGDRGLFEMAQLLISLGGNVDFSNSHSNYFSPYQLAQANRDSAPEIFELFSEFTTTPKWEHCKPLVYSFQLHHYHIV